MLSESNLVHGCFYFLTLANYKVTVGQWELECIHKGEFAICGSDFPVKYSECVEIRKCYSSSDFSLYELAFDKAHKKSDNTAERQVLYMSKLMVLNVASDGLEE